MRIDLTEALTVQLERALDRVERLREAIADRDRTIADLRRELREADGIIGWHAQR